MNRLNDIIENGEASAARMLAAARVVDLRAHPKQVAQCLKQARRMEAQLSGFLAEADGEGKVLKLRGPRAAAVRNPRLISALQGALDLLDKQCATCGLCPSRRD